MFSQWAVVVPLDGQDKSRAWSPTLKKARLQSITFPRCFALGSSNLPSSPSSPPDLNEIAKIFSTIRKPTDITPKHLQLLNVTYSYDLPLATLIPKKYHPDEKDENSLFNQRKRELTVENQDAYDFLTRKRRDVKIGMFYKFFQAVELIEMVLSTEETPAKQEKSTPSSPVSPSRGNSDKPIDPLGSATQRSNAKFREELIKQFVDPIAWNFNFRLYPPRYPPKVFSQKSLFSTRFDMLLHLQPSVSQERKEGIIIGPALVLQTRHEENYTETDDIVDVVHELSALLYLGQERQKKGMFKKVRFQAVGKDEKLAGDDLFLISCVNHHLALTHLYLTDAFIKFLRTGKLPSEEYQKANPEWCSCRMGRSRWHSLIDPDGRIEALRLVMSVLNWMNRKD